MKRIKAHDILNAAADILENEGWVKHDYSTDGKFCAVGAIWEAGKRGGLVHVRHPAIRRAEKHLMLQLPERYHLVDRYGFMKPDCWYKSPSGAVTDWNDATRRHRPEVLRVIRAAAKKSKLRSC